MRKMCKAFRDFKRKCIAEGWVMGWSLACAQVVAECGSIEGWTERWNCGWGHAILIRRVVVYLLKKGVRKCVIKNITGASDELIKNIQLSSGL